MGRSPFVRLRRRLAADNGFSLIEAVVALSILALVSTSFTYGMNLALRVTRDDRLRQQATHLAERELEIVRNEFQHSDETGQLGVLPGGTGSPTMRRCPGGTKGEPLWPSTAGSSSSSGRTASSSRATGRARATAVARWTT